MENVGIGDVVFIIFILGVIHGIMQLITTLRNRKKAAENNVQQE